ncbi:hypothetical protein OIV83_000537 [Microbotryomycetes sp. JL201]|nr:hypothetical protein OIV83_000537 [Microbotryomycetes sp. JL201]
MATYSPFIVVPPLTTCTNAYLLVVLPTGTANGTVLEFIPPVANDKPVKWRVGYNEGANITFLLTDSRGQTAYSEFRVVQKQLDTGLATCSRNVYDTQSSNVNVGAAVGGSLAGLLLILGIVLAFWLHRRRATNEHTAPSRPETPNEASWHQHHDAGVVRRGTFNLRHLPGVQLNEDSLDAHRLSLSEPPPPRYVPPEPKADDDDDDHQDDGRSSISSSRLGRSPSGSQANRAHPQDTIVEVELPTISHSQNH